MKSYTNRNPIPVAIIGIVVLALAFTATMFSEDLPIIGSGTTYTAEFDEAAGIQADDEVRVAGVKVGKVTDVGLENGKVIVAFKVKDAWLGDRTRAAIKIKTLLGQKFLALTPEGQGTLEPSQAIPLHRTNAPYDVLEAFRGLSNTVDEIDTNQLAKSFETISGTFANTPDDVRGALSGLSSLSKTISKRDEQLAKLLDNTKRISKTLSGRNTEVQRLVTDGNKLLGEIQNREQAISALLRGAQTLSRELRGLVDDNDEQLQPVLAQLDQLTGMLHRNQESLRKGLHNLAPFARQFTNTLGNGRWFDAFMCGFIPPAVGPINEEGCRL